MSFFTKKYIKIPIVCLVIVSLLLQFAPSPKPVQADWVENALGWLQQRISRVSLPNLDLTEEGSLKIGGLTLFDCVSREKGECLDWADPEPPQPLDLNNLLTTANEKYQEDRETFYGEGDCDYLWHIDADGSQDGYCYEEDLESPICDECTRLSACIDTIKAMTSESGGMGLNIPRLQGVCVDLNISILNNDPEEERECVRWEQGDCTNPFKKFSIKLFGLEAKSQKTLISDEGEILAPKLNYPPQCELRIPMPDDNELTSEQTLALRKACTAFMRLQKEVSSEIYIAKKIFNNTDPFSECSFIRNCRSSCSMRLGEFTYQINIADVAIALLPGGIITIIQKVLNIKKIVTEVTRVVTAIKTLARDGIAIVNNIMSVVHNVSSFFEATRDSGIKMSDALIFGGGMLLSNYAGGKLKDANLEYEFKIGVGDDGAVGWFKRRIGDAGDLAVSGGNILLERAGWAMTAGDGALGGVGLSVVLNNDRVSDAVDGLKDLLLNFANNNLKFSTAKSAALTLIQQTEQDTEVVRSQFKSEPEINFLFEDNEEKRRLEKIRERFLLTFEGIDSFLGEMTQAGELKNDKTILTTLIGENEMGEMDGNTWEPAIVDGGSGPDYWVYEFAESPYVELRIPEYDNINVLYEPFGEGGTINQCRFEQPRVTNVSKCPNMGPDVVMSVGSDIVPDRRMYGEEDEVLMDILRELPDYYGNTAVVSSPSAFFSNLRGCTWFENLKGIYQNANTVKVFVDGGEHILDVIEKSLSSGCGKKECDNCYDCSDLDHTKDPWVDYWRTIASAMGLDDSYYSHEHTMDRVIEVIDAFKYLKEIQDESTGVLGKNMASDSWLNNSVKEAGTKGWVMRRVQEYLDARNTGYLDVVAEMIEENTNTNTADLGGKIEKLWWQRATLLADYEFAKNEDEFNRDRTPYWEEVAWTSVVNSIPVCRPINGEIKLKFFDPSYDSDIMYQNWDGRIELLVKASKGLPILQQALEWEVPPQEPMMSYWVEKAKHDIDAILQPNEAIDNATREVVNEAINKIIDEFKVEYDYLNSKYAYDNYVNCCSCEVSGGNNLNTSNKDACGTVQDKSVCGISPEITSDSMKVYLAKPKSAPASSLNAVDTLDNLNCEVGLNKSAYCKYKYDDGTNSNMCTGGPNPTCESWIRTDGCSTCEDCVDSCVDNCEVDCDTVPGPVSEMCSGGNCITIPAFSTNEVCTGGSCSVVSGRVYLCGDEEYANWWSCAMYSSCSLCRRVNLNDGYKCNNSGGGTYTGPNASTDCNQNCDPVCHTEIIRNKEYQCIGNSIGNDSGRYNDPVTCERNCEPACTTETQPNRFRCDLPGKNETTYIEEETCEGVCKRDNCETEPQCESSYCSNPPNNNGTGGGACYWEEYYEEQEDSFQSHEAYYKEGFDKYSRFRDLSYLLERVRGSFNELLSGESDLVADLIGKECVDNSVCNNNICDDGTDCQIGTLDILKADFLRLQSIWNTPMSVWSCPTSGKTANLEYLCNNKCNTRCVEINYYESLIAKEYVTKMIDSVEIAQSITDENGTLVGVEGAVEALERLSNSLKEMISGLTPKVKDAIQNNLIDLLDEFAAVTRADIIIPVRDSLGKYEADCLETGFLNQIACFEEDNERTFIEILDFLDALKDMEDIALTLPLVGETVIDIEPEFRMDPPQIRADILDQTLNKAKACGLGFLPGSIENLVSDEDRNEAICNKKVSFFQAPQEGARDFSAFRKAILDNPLDSLEDKFGAIEFAVNNTINPAIKRIYDRQNQGEGRVELSSVFGTASDSARLDKYETAMEGIREEVKTLWWDLISGKAEKEELRRACQASSLILDSRGDPADIEDGCLTIDTYLLERDDYPELKTKCTELSKLNLEELDNIQAIEAELNTITNSRSCIETVECSDNTEHCIACPLWICTGTTDPRCCKTVNENGVSCDENVDGYYNNAIWEGTTPEIQISETDSVKTDVCQEALLGNSCTVSDLRTKCTALDDVVMSEFANVGTSLVPVISANIDKLKSDMACITSEKCELNKGSVNELYTVPITKTPEGKPCISCPKWICENLDDNLQNVDDLHCTDNASVDPIFRGNLDTDDNKIKADKSDSTYDGIIWDTTWNNGVSKWPRPTACLNVSSNLTVPEQLATKNKIGQIKTITQNCITKQKELEEQLKLQERLLASEPAEEDYIWNEEEWPCRSEDECENLQSACDKLDGGTAVGLASGWNKWPPNDPCDSTQIVDHRFRITNACKSSQEREETLAMIGDVFTSVKEGIDTLEGVDTDGDGVAEPVKDIGGLVHLCNGVSFQESVKEECDLFYKLRGAFDCSSGCDPDLLKTIGQFCNKDAVGVKVDEFKCSRLGSRTGVDFTFNKNTPFNGSEDAKATKVREAWEARQEARRVCTDSFSDMRTPLNEVMRVFSILLGIRNYTGAKKGMGGTWNPLDKNSGLRKSTEDLFKQGTKVSTMIMGKKCADGSDCDGSKCANGDKCAGSIFKILGDLWGEEDSFMSGTTNKISFGGFKVEKPLRCESSPMESFTSGGTKNTGPQGGQVCPDVANFFSQINAKFQLIRQYLKKIDLMRRNAKVDLQLGSLKIDIAQTGDINPELNEVVGPLYSKAFALKEKSQLIWAMATAINFASENCTCGQSFCPTVGKIPFCVSGLPLTASPITNPYCTLVWTLRYALGSLTDVIEMDLEDDFR